MKKATKFLISAFVVMALAASCSKSSSDTGSTDTGTGDTGSGDTGSGDTGSGDSTTAASITFSATAPEGESFSSGDKLSVYAYDTAGTLYEANQGYSYSSGSFSASTPITYSSATQTLNIVALYPQKSSYATLEDWTSFTVYTNQSTVGTYDASNLMMATVQAKDNNDKPELTFSRLLSKVVVNVESKDDSIPITSLESVKLTAYTKVSGSISAAGVASFTADTSAEVTMSSDGLSNGVDVYKAIVAPSGTIKGSITMSDDSYSGSTSFTDDSVLEAGQVYTVNLTIKNMEVEVTSVTITDWDSYDGDDTELGTYYE